MYLILFPFQGHVANIYVEYLYVDMLMSLYRQYKPQALFLILFIWNKFRIGIPVCEEAKIPINISSCKCTVGDMHNYPVLFLLYSPVEFINS